MCRVPVDPLYKIANTLKQKEYLEKELYALIKADESIFDFMEDFAFQGFCYKGIQSYDTEFISSRLRVALGYGPDDAFGPVIWQTYIDSFKTADDEADHWQVGGQLPDRLVDCRHRNGSVIWMNCRGLIVGTDNPEQPRLLVACTQTVPDAASITGP